MRLRLPVAVGLLAAAATPAAADVLDDALGPRELATGEARRGEVSGAQAISLNPAGLPMTRELTFEGSYGYRSIDAASLISISACDSTNAAPGCFYYRYAGSDTADGRRQRSHIAGMALSRIVNARATIGLGARYINDAGALADGSEDVKGFNWDAAATLKLTDTLNLAVIGHNLWGVENSRIARTVSSGVSLRASPTVLAVFDARWNLSTDGDTGRYGGGLEYYIATANRQTGYPLRAGAVHDVVSGTYLTGGLGMITVKFAVDVGVRKQIRDGDDLQLGVALRVFGPQG